jgi:acetolactate decarboxylase
VTTLQKGGPDSKPIAQTGSDEKMKEVLCSVAVLLAAGACRLDAFAAEGPTDGSTYTVAWLGEMRRVHLEGDASPCTDLSIVERGPGSFAIGPLAGLRGEITVVDGVVCISRFIEGEEQMTHDWNQQAPFLVYGLVNGWVEVSPPDRIDSIAGLESWLHDAARLHGLDTARPFPFKVETVDSTIAYHVIANDVPGYRTVRPHDELKHHFTSRREPVTLIGVFSTGHAGVFTHHGSSTHIHLVSADGHRSGHVDDITLGVETHYYLPAP